MQSKPTELIVDVPDMEYLSSNDRMHWRPERQRKRALRNRGMMLARQAGLIVPTPAMLIVEVGLRTGGRADPPNAEPTVKCLIDGIVDAGAIADDNSDFITSTTYRRGPRVTEKGWRRIHLIFHDQTVPF